MKQRLSRARYRDALDHAHDLRLWFWLLARESGYEARLRGFRERRRDSQRELLCRQLSEVLAEALEEKG